MKYSNYAKIVDPNSEYYGHVFEVDWINLKEKDVFMPEIGITSFSQIQFCVTKDNEPVKIGEEYVCIGDKATGDAIYDWVELDDGLDVFIKDKGVTRQYGIEDFVFQPLHPTNKIKITAEKIEELDVNKIRGEYVEYKGPKLVAGGNDTIESIKMVAEKMNQIIQAVNRLTK